MNPTQLQRIKSRSPIYIFHLDPNLDSNHSHLRRTESFQSDLHAPKNPNHNLPSFKATPPIYAKVYSFDMLQPALRNEERAIIRSYGGWTQFMLCFGLKPCKSEDADEAMTILRALLASDEEEENALSKRHRR